LECVAEEEKARKGKQQRVVKNVCLRGNGLPDLVSLVLADASEATRKGCFNGVVGVLGESVQ
jgi:hypothetical protein